MYYITTRSVLNAYSNFHPSVGYIQGMNIIVSAILSNICDDYDQIEDYTELVFKLLVSLMDSTRVCQYYKSKMKKMMRFFESVQTIVADEFQQVHTYLKKEEVW